jgi:outer membrane protein assembly factor BamD
MNELAKSRMIEELTKDAADAYGKIIRRYPAMDRAFDAKARLEALHQPVPRPTRAALEQNKKEVASRHEAGMMSSMLNGFEKHPDVAKAAHVGDPTMVDPEPETATRVVQQMANAAKGGDNAVSAETIHTNANGEVAPNQEAPRSDTGTATTDPATADAKPAVAADPNELKPNVEPDANALPPLQQSNQLDSNGGTSASSSIPAKTEEMADISSSKKKKKKGLAKMNPF